VKLYLRKGISFQLTLATQLGIIIVSRNSWSQQASPSLNTHHSLQKAFESLHPALKNICGTVQFPKDNGGEILRSVQNTKKIYMGLAMQRSETDAQHMHGLYHLVISMTLDGISTYMSSSHDELAGLTAITIISKRFLDYHASKARITAFYDNQAIQHKFNSLNFNNLL
jgi:hypothetical protein